MSKKFVEQWAEDYLKDNGFLGCEMSEEERQLRLFGSYGYHVDEKGNKRLLTVDELMQIKVKNNE